MKLLRIKDLHTHGLNQKKKKKNFMIKILINYLISNKFHEGLKKGERMEDQVGLFFQYYNIDVLFPKLFVKF